MVNMINVDSDHIALIPCCHTVACRAQACIPMNMKHLSCMPACPTLIASVRNLLLCPCDSKWWQLESCDVEPGLIAGDARGHSMVSVLCAQRDRFRARVSQLEDDLGRVLSLLPS